MVASHSLAFASLSHFANCFRLVQPILSIAVITVGMADLKPMRFELQLP